MDNTSLKDKLILVTGGGSGIGKATCKLAAKLGAVVIVADINRVTAEETKTEIEKEGISKNHAAFEVDVSNKDSVEQLSKNIEHQYSNPPSTVIHCAGIFGLNEESEEKNWQTVIDVNLKGTFLISTTFAKLMKENGIHGAIVNMSSTLKDGFVHACPYSSSKAGVCGITKTIAHEYGQFNIRCNAVAPGAIDTPMSKAAPAEIINRYVACCAMNRIGRPEEVASVCLFLGSEASSYVNGAVLVVDGGRFVVN